MRCSLNIWGRERLGKQIGRHNVVNVKSAKFCFRRQCLIGYLMVGRVKWIAGFANSFPKHLKSFKILFSSRPVYSNKLYCCVLCPNSVWCLKLPITEYSWIPGKNHGLPCSCSTWHRVQEPSTNKKNHPKPQCINLSSFNFLKALLYLALKKKLRWWCYLIPDLSNYMSASVTAAAVLLLERAFVLVKLIWFFWMNIGCPVCPNI